MRRSFLATLLVALFFATTAYAGIHLRGQAVSNAYPLAVSNAALQAVWDYHTSGVGSRVPRGSMTAGASFSFPAGLAYKTHAGGSGDGNASIDVSSGTNSISSLDTDAGIYIYNAGTSLTLTDSYLSNANLAAGSYSFTTNQNNGGTTKLGAITFTGSYLTVDQTGILHAHANTFGTGGGGNGIVNTVALDHILFIGAPGDTLVTDDITISDSAFLYAFTNPNSTNSGTNCPPSGQAHIENTKFNHGNAVLTRVLIDPSVDQFGAPATIDWCKAGVTGVTFGTAVGSGAVTADGAGNLIVPVGTDVHTTFDQSIVIGTAFMDGGTGSPAPYTNQSKCVAGYNVTTTFTNSVIQKGGSAYNTNVNQGYLALTGVTGATPNGAITGGTSGAKARFQTYTAGTGLVSLQPCLTQPACTSAGSGTAWGTPFTDGETVTWPGGSATLGHSLLNTCQMIMGTGNWDFDTAQQIPPGTL